MAMTSLFDFAVDMGAKLFGKDSESQAATAIKAMLERETTMPITNLDVKYDDGVVTLCGECQNADDKEKAVLLAGNVQFVKKVMADDLKAPPQQAKVQYYVVKKGDSLSKIAKEFYGNAMDYPKIFEANREVIKDPDLIYPGQKLRIPEA